MFLTTGAPLVAGRGCHPWVLNPEFPGVNGSRMLISQCFSTRNHVRLPVPVFARKPRIQNEKSWRGDKLKKNCLVTRRTPAANANERRERASKNFHPSAYLATAGRRQPWGFRELRRPRPLSPVPVALRCACSYNYLYAQAQNTPFFVSFLGGGGALCSH